MKVPLSWLKEHIATDLSPEEIAERLTSGGVEVEKIERLQPSFSGVVIGRVVRAERHPRADRLAVATVWDGSQEFQVVCGAPNCREGLRTAFARVGAQVRDKSGAVTAIKKAKLRDVESQGMLCSEEELGLSAEGHAIAAYGEELAEGSDLASLYTDVLFDLSMTPNLGHCLSIRGIARELAALLGGELLPEPAPLCADRGRELSERGERGALPGWVEVAIEEPSSCPRYACGVLSHVEAAPTPFWIKRRLELCGLRSIHLLVDIGNYVMLEWGQPLHIFDYEAIDGKRIVVRPSRTAAGERLATLDGAEREVPAETLLIASATSPLAFAGIMGGLSSAVSASTRTILIESAHFAPEVIRRGCKKLGLRTDAAYRFERGVDAGAPFRILQRAVDLVMRWAPGASLEGMLDLQALPVERREIAYRPQRVNALLGTQLSAGEMSAILERWGIEPLAPKVSEASDLPVQRVAIPTVRRDLREEIDLVEEIGRIYGFAHIPRLRPYYPTSPLAHAPAYLFEQRVRSLLLRLGLQECMTCNLISSAEARFAIERRGGGEELLIHVLHPQSVDQSILRPSLLPGLLQVCAHNAHRQIASLACFEVGRIYFKEGEHYREQMAAALVLMGERTPLHWEQGGAPCDFFDLKGYVEGFLAALSLDGCRFTPSHVRCFHPGRQASIEGQAQGVTLGLMGEVHPQQLELLGIQQPVLFAEFNLHDLFPPFLSCRAASMCGGSELRASAPPLYPSIQRDWTLTLPEATPIGRLLEAVERVRTPLLEEIRVIGLYRGEQVGLGKKNATLRFLYRSRAATLAAEEADREHARLMENVACQLRDVLSSL